MDSRYYLTAANTGGVRVKGSRRSEQAGGVRRAQAKFVPSQAAPACEQQRPMAVARVPRRGPGLSMLCSVLYCMHVHGQQGPTRAEHPQLRACRDSIESAGGCGAISVHNICSLAPPRVPCRYSANAVRLGPWDRASFTCIHSQRPLRRLAARHFQGWRAPGRWRWSRGIHSVMCTSMSRAPAEPLGGLQRCRGRQSRPSLSQEPTHAKSLWQQQSSNSTDFRWVSIRPAGFHLVLATSAPLTHPTPRASTPYPGQPRFS